MSRPGVQHECHPGTRPPTPQQLFSKHKKQYYYVDGPMIGHAANFLNIHITIIQQGQYQTTQPGEPTVYWPTVVFTYTPQSPNAATTPITIEFINSRGAIGTTHATTPKNDHYRPLLPTPPISPNHIHDPPIPRVRLDSPLLPPPLLLDITPNKPPRTTRAAQPFHDPPSPSTYRQVDVSHIRQIPGQESEPFGYAHNPQPTLSRPHNPPSHASAT